MEVLHQENTIYVRVTKYKLDYMTVVHPGRYQTCSRTEMIKPIERQEVRM